MKYFIINDSELHTSLQLQLWLFLTWSGKWVVAKRPCRLLSEGSGFWILTSVDLRELNYLDVGILWWSSWPILEHKMKQLHICWWHAGIRVQRLSTDLSPAQSDRTPCLLPGNLTPWWVSIHPKYLYLNLFNVPKIAPWKPLSYPLWRIHGYFEEYFPMPITCTALPLLAPP